MTIRGTLGYNMEPGSFGSTFHQQKLEYGIEPHPFDQTGVSPLESATAENQPQPGSMGTSSPNQVTSTADNAGGGGPVGGAGGQSGAFGRGFLTADQRRALGGGAGGGGGGFPPIIVARRGKKGDKKDKEPTDDTPKPGGKPAPAPGPSWSPLATLGAGAAALGAGAAALGGKVKDKIGEVAGGVGDAVEGAKGKLEGAVGKAGQQAPALARDGMSALDALGDGFNTLKGGAAEGWRDIAGGADRLWDNGFEKGRDLLGEGSFRAGSGNTPENKALADRAARGGTNSSGAGEWLQDSKDNLLKGGIAAAGSAALGYGLRGMMKTNPALGLMVPMPGQEDDGITGWMQDRMKDLMPEPDSKKKEPAPGG